MVSTWRGKILNEMSKDELVEALEKTGIQLENAIDKAINPPIILSQDYQKFVTDAVKETHDKYWHIGFGLYWKQK